MISEKMKGYVANSSVIRAMFEEGKKMAAIYGADHVYDFSLGNPNVPAPGAVKDAIIDIVTNEDPVLVHGYMSNSGFEDVRTKIAEHLNAQYGTSYTFNNLVMIVGAAGGMNVFFKTLLNPGDEVVTFSPYFGEYRAYVSNFDGRLVEVQTDPVTFEPDPKALAAAVTPKTKAVILNSPNNPTGVVYSEECIREIATLLEEKQKEYLLKLCREYVELFLEGSNQVMGNIFGFQLERNKEKKVAVPVAEMIGRIRTDEKLLPEQREQLWKALYQGYTAWANGKTEYLDEQLMKTEE